MQIRASQRRQAVSARPPHRVLAQRWALQRRLVAGGAAALVASLLAWLFGVSLPLHLGFVAAAFAGGFFWRFRRVGHQAERWAFSWIEAQAGLSYLTAYELADPDTSGFREAVQARAAQVGRLETPPLQPWALPLVVLALALAAVPHFVLPTLRAPLAPLTEQLPGALQTPETGAAPGAERTDPAPKTATSPETGDAAPEQGEGAAGEPNANAETDAAADKQGADGQSFDSSPTSAADAAERESEALGRFLEQNGTVQDGASPASSQPDAAQPGTPPPGGAQATTPRTDSSDPAGSGTNGEGNEAQRSNSETSSESSGQQRTPGNTPERQREAGAESGEGSPAGREAASEQGEGPVDENGAESGAQTSEAPEGESQAEQGSQAAQDDSASQAQPGSEAQQAQTALEQAGRDEGSASRTGGAAGQRQAAPNSGAETPQNPQGATGERAGTQPGGELESSRERLGAASANAPEQLGGSPGEGPVSFSGQTLRQGEAPDALPQTGTPESYQRAAEEVIREGRIPLEYQEIVRDYFR